jgi:hypothetical protein
MKSTVLEDVSIHIINLSVSILFQCVDMTELTEKEKLWRKIYEIGTAWNAEANCKKMALVPCSVFLDKLRRSKTVGRDSSIFKFFGYFSAKEKFSQMSNLLRILADSLNVLEDIVECQYFDILTKSPSISCQRFDMPEVLREEQSLKPYHSFQHLRYLEGLLRSFDEIRRLERLADENSNEKQSWKSYFPIR